MREEVHNAVIRIRKGVQIPADEIRRGNTMVGTMDDEAYVLAVTKTQTEVIVTTGIGKIVYPKNQLVNIADGELYTGILGCEVDYFLENLADYASANDELKCHINGYLFTVNRDDNVKTIMGKYNRSQEDVKNGITKLYHLA
jgi:hypothetical protein